MRTQPVARSVFLPASEAVRVVLTVDSWHSRQHIPHMQVSDKSARQTLEPQPRSLLVCGRGSSTSLQPPYNLGTCIDCFYHQRCGSTLHGAEGVHPGYHITHRCHITLLRVTPVPTITTFHRENGEQPPKVCHQGTPPFSAKRRLSIVCHPAVRRCCNVRETCEEGYAKSPKTYGADICCCFSCMFNNM